MAAAPRTLVLYIGNPIVTNDQIGLIAGRALASHLHGRADVEVQELTGSPLDILGHLEGYARLVIVDSMHLPGLEPGTVRVFGETEIRQHEAGFHVHGMNVADVLAAARRMELAVPDEVVLIGIEAGAMDRFGEQLGPELVARAEEVCREVAELVGRLLG